jgi:hypothetical protein
MGCCYAVPLVSAALAAYPVANTVSVLAGHHTQQAYLSSVSPKAGAGGKSENQSLTPLHHPSRAYSGPLGGD